MRLSRNVAGNILVQVGVKHIKFLANQQKLFVQHFQQNLHLTEEKTQISSRGRSPFCVPF